MKVQLANKYDHLDNIAKFQVAMARETEGLDLEFTVVQKGVAAVFDDESKGNYYVALNDEGECIASLLTVKEWSDWRCKDVLWIHSVFVVKEMRAKKVFKRMYQFLKDKVEHSNELAGLRLYVEKSNVKAQKAYEKIGMTREHYHLYEWLK